MSSLVDDAFIDCEICGEAHPGAADCPWDLFAAGLGTDPRLGGLPVRRGNDDVEYRRAPPSRKSTPVSEVRTDAGRSPLSRRPPPTGALDDIESVPEDVTRLVERLDTIIRHGIPAIPEIVSTAEDLVDATSLDGAVLAAGELRSIAEDLLGLAGTMPDVARRLCRLADAMEKT